MENEKVVDRIAEKVSLFKKAIKDMIATNDRAYQKGSHYRAFSNPIRNYTKDEVLDIIHRGTLSNQQKLSNDFYDISGIYRRIILYNATMLKYTGILIPDVTAANKDLTDSSLQKRYKKTLDFIDKINLPTILSDFSLKALINGCYYGVILDISQDYISILDLPAQYCCSRYKTANNEDLIEFNLQYFYSISDPDERELALSVYPKEIRAAFHKYEKGKKGKWFLIPSTIGICFPIHDGRPPFLSSIPAIIDYDDYVELEKERDEDEVKKILIQKVPHLNDGKLLFEPDEAEEMHAGAVGMMRNNKNVNVLTTYADADIISSQSTNDTSRNNIEKILKVIYDEAGISSELFAATGNLTLDKSIKNDLSFMMYLCNKYNNFITNIVNRFFSNSQIKFKYKILPISYYNDTDYLNNTHKLASSGYSFILPALAADLSQKDLVNVKDLEEALGLRDKLIPLSTSYTEAANSDEGGAPQKSEEEKSDKTLDNEEALDSSGGEE